MAQTFEPGTFNLPGFPVLGRSVSGPFQYNKIEWFEMERAVLMRNFRYTAGKSIWWCCKTAGLEAAERKGEYDWILDKWYLFTPFSFMPVSAVELLSNREFFGDISRYACGIRGFFRRTTRARCCLGDIPFEANFDKSSVLRGYADLDTAGHSHIL